MTEMNIDTKICEVQGLIEAERKIYHISINQLIESLRPSVASTIDKAVEYAIGKNPGQIEKLSDDELRTLKLKLKVLRNDLSSIELEKFVNIFFDETYLTLEEGSITRSGEIVSVQYTFQTSLESYLNRLNVLFRENNFVCTYSVRNQKDPLFTPENMDKLRLVAKSYSSLYDLKKREKCLREDKLKLLTKNRWESIN